MSVHRPERRLPSPVPADSASAGRQRAQRLPALDGLRGVAAMVVLVHHVLLLSPTYNELVPGFRPGEASWWLTSSPLFLVWAGTEAVLVFFVLSGLVLALPAVDESPRWRSYYPQRLVRLYLPVWASLVLAVALAALAPRTVHPELGSWYNDHAPGDSVLTAVHDAVLLLGTGYTNSPLWSLQWEMIFSLALPLYLLGGRLLPRFWGTKVVGLFALLAAVGLVTRREEPLFLAMFAFGVLIAFGRDRVATLARRVVEPGVTRVLVIGSCVGLLTVDATIRALGRDQSSVVVSSLASLAQALGACLVIVLALHWRRAVAFLSSGPVQWIGIRSFSLYLVHEPIAVSSGALWPELPVVVHLLITLVVALPAAHVFHRTVEQPAHRLSKAVARRMA